MRKRWLETELPQAVEHEEDMREAHEAHEMFGYKARWRVSWLQLIGWLIVAIIVVGNVLLVVHAAGGRWLVR